MASTTARANHPIGLAASISRIHIVAIATMGTFTFGWLFLGRYPWLLAAISGLDWFLVNLLNRVVDVPEDRVNRIRGADFASRHRRTIVVVGFAVMFGSLLLVHLVEPAITPLRVGYHALGLAYNWPLLPGRRRIKQLYFWKNMASATGFLLTVFGYPLAVAGWPLVDDAARAALPPGISAATIVLSAAFFLPFELSYEVIYDLRDAPGDRAAGVRSYPVVHGQRAAVRIIDALILASLVPLFAGYAAGLVPWRIVIMAFAPCVQLVFYKRALRRGIRARDCINLTWLGAALLLTYHLWVVAGLPGAELDS